MTRAKTAIRAASVTVATVGCMLAGLACSPAALAAGTPGWAVSSLAEPSNFAQADSAECAANRDCDHYTIMVTNAGSAASSGESVTILDTLPKGMTVVKIEDQNLEHAEFVHSWGEPAEHFTCQATEVTSAAWQAKCEYEEGVPAGDTLVMRVDVDVEATTKEQVTNTVEVSGGGAVAVKSGEPDQPQTAANTVNASQPPFGIQAFSFTPYGLDGTPETQAGAHPYAVSASFDLTTRIDGQPQDKDENIQEPKDVVVYLPLGMAGDPLAAPTCPAYELDDAANRTRGTECPAGSEVGSVILRAEGGSSFASSLGQYELTLESALYNITPERGYPAELGFAALDKAVLLQASVLPSATGYVLRVATPGVPRALHAKGVTLSIFGEPAQHDLNENGEPSSGPAFFTDPDDCSASPAAETARIEADSWEDPERWVSSEATAFQQPSSLVGLTNCDSLQFDPQIQMRPESSPAATQADEPSGYTFGLEVPQAPNSAPTLATPDLKDAVLTLPEGLSVSPGSAQGLTGCPATGAEGIDLGSSDALGPEVQEGEEIGADGLPHAARGHCALSSQIGTVKIKTPLLEEALSGHVYLAQPQCGQAGQAPCSEAQVEQGKAFGLDIEAESERYGVVVKLPGSVEVGGYGQHSKQDGLKPGQLRAVFENNPQLPFSSLALHLNGGARAPLATPQECGTYTTTSTLEPWSAPETPDATPHSQFTVGGCDGDPFAPVFLAQSTITAAGAYTPFTVAFSRKDGEQDLSGITVSTPPGLVAEIAKLTRCGEAQANAGSCPEASRIGTATAYAGAGSTPYKLTGSVYLTGPYKGDPFGLSIAVPAAAGPFRLAGNTGTGLEVVRAAIAVNPHNAALTIASEPLPQIIDGVPIRLQRVEVEVNRSDFVVNPTDCAQMQVAGTLTGVLPSGAAGATVGDTTPFAATGCAGLAFKPGFAVETHAGHTKKTGAYLKVTVTSGSGEANIAKVHVTLPKKLPAELATLNLACTEAQFAANPSGCPEGSFVGTATAATPVLAKALTGPAIFVSHGHAEFPNLDIVLQGEGVTVILEGATFISKSGYTSNTFASVPDVPVSSFELTLPQGAKPALAGEGNLCDNALDMPTSITGQNGAVVERVTKVKVSGCKTSKPIVEIKKIKLEGAALLVTIKTSRAGRIDVTGTDLKATKKSVNAGVHEVDVQLDQTGKKAKRKHEKIQIKVRLTAGKQTTKKTASTKL